MHVPYTCPRCGYKTTFCNDMRRHLYEKKRNCHGEVNNIELTDEIKDTIMRNKLYHIPKQDVPNKSLINTINKLQHEIDMLKDKKSERFYQNIVEKFLGGTHKKVLCGVTDVTTDNIHAEIKNAKDYKTAIGQLVSYNSVDNKKQLQLYLFGPKCDTYFDTAKVVCECVNIELYKFNIIHNTINIINGFTNDLVFTYEEE